MFTLRKLKAVIRIKLEVYEKIAATLGSQEPEQGGYLISEVNGQNVKAVNFIYDFSANTSAAAYSPDTAVMSPKIDKAIASDKYVTAVVHIHPDGCPTYSEADEEYAKDIIDAYDLPFFDVGVGQLRAYGNPDLRFYRVYPRNSRKKVELIPYEDRKSVV